MSPIQKLIESLRNELQQYGEMLALLDQQHQAVMNDGPDDVLHLISAINKQGLAIQKARDIRHAATVKLARSLGQKTDPNFASLIPLLPGHLRALVTALVQENNALLVSVRDKAQQNHQRMQKSLDMMNHFVANLKPSDTTLITLDSQVPPHPSDSSIYEAIA